MAPQVPPGVEKWPALQSLLTIDAGLLELYDVEFFPFPLPDLQPIFAVTGDRFTIICRLPADLEQDQQPEIIRWFNDEFKGLYLNSLCWSYDPSTDEPLICVAGRNEPDNSSANIAVLNVITGKVEFNLVGHGRAINELAISPTSPRILASASDDHTVRLWYLDKQSERQPCAAIFTGIEGHRAGVLSMVFHPTGNFLLTGGFDAAVKLWKIPPSLPEKAGTDHPHHVSFPLFSTTGLHHDSVDSVAFFSDFVLSKCASDVRCCIKLWRILGFSSDADAVTDEAVAPRVLSEETTSSLGPGFEVLLTFDPPESPSYYVRFGLFHRGDKDPMLAITNQSGQLLFWNFRDIEDGRRKVDRSKSAVPVGGAFEPHPAHHVLQLPASAGFKAICYRVAWSVDGEWCVAVGSASRVYILHRSRS